jgi:hypothetical protein
LRCLNVVVLRLLTSDMLRLIVTRLSFLNDYNISLVLWCNMLASITTDASNLNLNATNALLIILDVLVIVLHLFRALVFTLTSPILRILNDSILGIYLSFLTLTLLALLGSLLKCIKVITSVLLISGLF